jgi:CRISPR-associated protein Csd1
MLRGLKEAYDRFRKEGTLLPPVYKEKSVSWFIHLGKGKASLEGPYSKRDGVKPVPAPDRQRSGKASESNLKPYLLVDDARYVLGFSQEGKEEEAALLHKGFKELTEKAWRETKDPDAKAVLKEVLDFLTSPELEDLREEFRRRGGKPKDLLAFKVHGILPTELEEVQAFWAQHLAEEIQEGEGFCALCGNLGPVLRIFPRELVVLGQKCQLVSFNQEAFESFGKEQAANAPLCFTCASQVVDTLDHLIRSELHKRALYWEEGGGLRNQLAVFWLSEKVEVPLEERPVDLEALLGDVLSEAPTRSLTPPADLTQLQELLAMPWTGKAGPLNLDETRFYLAILSANKGRLVVREWFAVSLARLKETLGRFLEGTRLVGPWGEAPHPLPVGALVQALGDGNPGLVRGLLRTAYLGTPPPHALSLAAHLLRNPKVLTPEDREGWRRLHALVAALKLWLFYGKKEAKRMAELDRERKDPAYLSGRLLAVLEEAQKRASGYTLKRTLVDRFYGAASTTPAATFGALLRLSTTAHLPKVGKELNQAVEEILSQLDEAGGFPRTLNLIGQAKFALGFYHQRAYFRANRGKKAGKQEETQAETETVTGG